MATSSYKGPTRAEILHLVLEYNESHHRSRSISISPAGSENDMTDLKGVVHNEKIASESARQIKKSINELWELKRQQLRKGTPSSIYDWESFVAVCTQIKQEAEKGLKDFTPIKGKAPVSQAQLYPYSTHNPQLSFVAQSSHTLSKPSESKLTIPSPGFYQIGPQGAPQAIRGPQIYHGQPTATKAHAQTPAKQPVQHVQAPGHQHTHKQRETTKPPEKTAPSPSPHPKPHGHAQATDRPADSKTISPSPHPKNRIPESHHGHKQPHDTKLAPTAVGDLHVHRPQNPEEKAAQRKAMIERKESMAHLQAKKLHSEVRKLSL